MLQEYFGNTAGIQQECCRNTRFFNKPLASTKHDFEEDNFIDTRTEEEYVSQCGQHNLFELVDLRQDYYDYGGLPQISEEGEWPHMCTIWEKTAGKNGGSDGRKYLCGASLVSNNAVLTTWHNIR